MDPTNPPPPPPFDAEPSDFDRGQMHVYADLASMLGITLSHPGAFNEIENAVADALYQLRNLKAWMKEAEQKLKVAKETNDSMRAERDAANAVATVNHQRCSEAETARALAHNTIATLRAEVEAKTLELNEINAGYAKARELLNARNAELERVKGERDGTHCACPRPSNPKFAQNNHCYACRKPLPLKPTPLQEAIGRADFYEARAKRLDEDMNALRARCDRAEGERDALKRDLAATVAPRLHGTDLNNKSEALLSWLRGAGAPTFAVEYAQALAEEAGREKAGRMVETGRLLTAESALKEAQGGVERLTVDRDYWKHRFTLTQEAWDETSADLSRVKGECEEARAQLKHECLIQDGELRIARESLSTLRSAAQGAIKALEEWKRFQSPGNIHAALAALSSAMNDDGQKVRAYLTHAVEKVAEAGSVPFHALPVPEGERKERIKCRGDDNRCQSTATHGPNGEPVVCWSHAGDWPLALLVPRASTGEVDRG